MPRCRLRPDPFGLSSSRPCSNPPSSPSETASGRRGCVGSVSSAQSPGGEAGEESDVDVLVRFHPEARTLDNLLTVADALEQVFHRRVDLVTEDSLSPYLRPRILPGVKYVNLGD
jgi:predicted nucleotidyltransferase